jgi:hypothetical protein
MTYIYIPTVSADQGGWQKETNSNRTAEEAASPEQGHVSFALGLWLLASFGNLQLAQQAWDLSGCPGSIWCSEDKQRRRENMDPTIMWVSQGHITGYIINNPRNLLGVTEHAGFTITYS